jgi:hypothetical protein
VAAPNGAYILVTYGERVGVPATRRIETQLPRHRIGSGTKEEAVEHRRDPVRVEAWTIECTNTGANMRDPAQLRIIPAMRLSTAHHNDTGRHGHDGQHASHRARGCHPTTSSRRRR